MVAACNKCFDVVERNVQRAFGIYGRFVARHPWTVIIIAIFVNCGLGIGMIRLNSVTDVETVYTPMGSQASEDADKVRAIFPDLSGSNHRSYQMPDVGKYARVLVRPNSGAIMDTTFLTSLNQLYTFLTQISTTDDSGNVVQFTTVCAMRDGVCSIDGDLFVDSEFATSVTANSVDYPLFTHSTRGQIYYEQDVAGAIVISGKLQSATMVSFTLHLRTDTNYYVSTAEKWQDAFLTSIESYSNADFTIAYSHTDSLSEELGENITGDIGLFSVTFTLMITYACIATLTARCDAVGQRGFLGMAGVLPAVLAIVASFGLCSACGVDFVSIVGVVPFLIIGIGVDDMFLLLSGITGADYRASIEERIGQTMATSGVSITITSLTDLLAFAAGASSVFLSVRNFCIYAGVAVVFCYINQSSMFLACIAINESRTKSNRHFSTCRQIDRKADDDESVTCKVEIENETSCLPPCRISPVSHQTETALPETDTQEENQNNLRLRTQRTYESPKPSCSKDFCSFLCCSGRPPLKQEESESYLDKLPRWLIPKLVSPKKAKIIILVLFAIYLGVSIWGVTEMKEGLDLKNLVSKDSYAYKYHEWLEEFPKDTIVSFVFDSEMSYSDPNTKTAIDSFISYVKSNDMVRDDFEINWFSSFDSSADKSSETAYVTSLQAFLAVPSNSRFQNDVIIDTTRNVITSSRIHLISETLAGSQEQGKFMLRMRELAEESSLSVFAFSPAFLYFEQFVAILPQTLQTVGIAIAMVFFVTCLFMPHPLLLIYITFTVVMITVGIFGFLDFLSLTLSSITMIHLIMSIGFSVDFAAHICHGYMISTGKNRNERMINGVIRSGAPIFHGAMSSLLGVIILGFAQSYIFFSFFKVMTFVILFGILHALFLLPVVLSFIGPPPTIKISVKYIPSSVDNTLISNTISQNGVSVRSCKIARRLRRVSDDKGEWDLIVDSATIKEKPLSRCMKFGEHVGFVFHYGQDFGIGQSTATTHITVRNIPLSVDNTVIAETFFQRGLDVLSYDIRGVNCWQCLTDEGRDRVFIVKTSTLNKPLSRCIEFREHIGFVFHAGQNVYGDSEHNSETLKITVRNVPLSVEDTVIAETLFRKDLDILYYKETKERVSKQRSADNTIIERTLVVKRATLAEPLLRCMQFEEYMGLVFHDDQEVYRDSDEIMGTLRMNVRNVPSSVEEAVIAETLFRKGLDVLLYNKENSSETENRRRSDASTDWIFVVKSSSLKEPLPRCLKFRDHMGFVFHLGQEVYGDSDKIKGTLKIKVRNLTLSVDDTVIARGLFEKGLDVLFYKEVGSSENDRRRNGNEETERVYIVKSDSLKEPLPLFMAFEENIGYILHDWHGGDGDSHSDRETIKINVKNVPSEVNHTVITDILSRKGLSIIENEKDGRDKTGECNLKAKFETLTSPLPRCMQFGKYVGFVYHDGQELYGFSDKIKGTININVRNVPLSVNDNVIAETLFRKGLDVLFFNKVNKRLSVRRRISNERVFIVKGSSLKEPLLRCIEFEEHVGFVFHAGQEIYEDSDVNMETIKIKVRKIPLSVDNAVIAEVLFRKGLDVLFFNEANKNLTNSDVPAERIFIVKSNTLCKPLSRCIKFGKHIGFVFHAGQEMYENSDINEETLKIIVRKIPLTVDDTVIAEVFFRKGLDVLFYTTMTERENDEHQEGGCKGDRIFIVKSDTVKDPLPRQMSFGGHKGLVYHDGQKVDEQLKPSTDLVTSASNSQSTS